MAETCKPGGGRKPSKPEYNAEWNLTQQMDAATALYKENHSLQSIADALNLNPIKVRKLLITAGIYESDIAKMVQCTFKAARSRTEESTWAGQTPRRRPLGPRFSEDWQMRIYVIARINIPAKKETGKT